MKKLKPANELWAYVSEKGLKPQPKTSTSVWADSYRMLSAGISAEPGRWKTSRAPYQQEIMDAFTQSGVNKVVVMSSSQIGKALKLSTPIATPDGWKTIEALKIGDKVFDENGYLCNVIACTEVMKSRPCYEITFSDGSQLIADENHDWYIQTDKADGIKATRDMVGTYKNGKRNVYAIPVNRPLVTDNHTELILKPYTLGVWLGDGNSRSAQITMPDYDLFIADKMKKDGYEVVVQHKDKNHSNVMTVKFNPYNPDDPICKRGHNKQIVGLDKYGHCMECNRQLSLKNKWKGKKEIFVDPVTHIQKTGHYLLKKLNLINNKHIPVEYLRASQEARWQLLQGIMDTDGYVSPKGICELTLKSKRLIDGVSELLCTLGIKHTLKKKKAVCTNSPTRKSYDVWRITFTAYEDMPVFSLPRKKARLSLRTGNRRSETERRRITDIKFAGYEDTKCIQVDSPSHLYLAGKAMIPTHNSDIMNNVIGRFAHLDPCPIMMIQPTIEMAEDFSKSRIAPMIRDTKVLNGLFYDIKSKNGKGEAKTRDGNNTILSKIFPGGRLIMCGANSPAGLASRPVRILLADEVDRFPASAGGEGDPVGLAEKRMTTFWNRVMGLFSTPTNEGESRIADEYLAGTQEEWQHQCPNCGEYHALRYVDMEADYSEHEDKKKHKIIVVNDVKWVCPDCGFKFSEQEIKTTLQKYVPQNPEAIQNGIRSFWLNAFTSPWLSWKQIMTEWLEARGDANREKVIVNTRFGEPYSLNDNTIDALPLMKRREQYGAALPDGVLLLTAAVDTQDNRLEYEVCGWGFGEACWGIVKGMILSKPDEADTWQALDDILGRIYTFGNGIGIKIARTFIDSGGHYTEFVYRYCEKNLGSGRFPIKGYANRPGIPLVYKLGKDVACKVPLVILGVDDGKQQVFNRLGVEEIGDKYFHFGRDGDEDLPYRGYDEVYFKGLLSEEKRLVKRNGVLKNVWIPKSGVRNEPLDLRVYNLAAMQSMKPDWGLLYEQLHGQKPPSGEADDVSDSDTHSKTSGLVASRYVPLEKRTKSRFSRRDNEENGELAPKREHHSRKNVAKCSSYTPNYY